MIVEIAQNSDVLVGLYFRGGDYVIEGGKGIGIYPAERASPELRKAIAQTITVGAHCTPAQDLEFSVRHPVEIAVRALSPGINDPYTAAAVNNQLSASLGRLMVRDLPPGVFTDGEGAVRAICERPTYASLLGAAFHQICQKAPTSRSSSSTFSTQSRESRPVRAHGRPARGAAGGNPAHLRYSRARD